MNAGLDVSEGVADEKAVFGGCTGEVFECLEQHAGKGLAAVAGVAGVGAEVDGVDIGIFVSEE